MFYKFVIHSNILDEGLNLQQIESQTFIVMDIQREKLRNRLNLKFQPTQINTSSHRYSLKKISLDKNQKIFDTSISKDKLLLKSRTKSISSIKLPSLQKINPTDNSTSILTTNAINLSPQRQKGSSIQLLIQQKQRISKQRNSHGLPLKLMQIKPFAPQLTHVNAISKLSHQNTISKLSNYQPLKIHVQSKSTIHETLTYLIKNQILTIPQIVGLLEKSNSNQFLYMKIINHYQYQVCQEKNKGKEFVTVSKNGMVIDGQLVTLNNLIHQFHTYKILKSIPFFKTFLWAKFFNKWSQGSRKAFFLENRHQIHKLLHLQNLKMLKWNQKLRQELSLNEKSGSLTQSWITKVSTSISDKKFITQTKLSTICYEILDKFNLPISESTQLLNKVLNDLNSLNLTFQVKMTIQKEMDTFYRFARNLQFYFVFSIGQFILNHLHTLSDRISKATSQYQDIILSRLQGLDINDVQYVIKKQKILSNSPSSSEIPFQMVMSQSCQILINPSPLQLKSVLHSHIQKFYQLIQRQSFKLIRTQKFKFVNNIVNRNVSNRKQFNQDKDFTIKDYVYSLDGYQALQEEVDNQLDYMDMVVQRRIQLVMPFIRVYQQFQKKNKLQFVKQLFYQQFRKQFQLINYKKDFVQKMHQGQNFIFGYMDQSNVKQIILAQILKYQKTVLNFIPKICKQQKQKISILLKQHLNRVMVQITSPDVYIQVYNQIQKIQDNLADYSAKLFELQRINQLYNKLSKLDIPSLNGQKLSLSQLRSKIKNFKQIKQSIYIQYRKDLQLQKRHHIQKVTSLSLKNQIFYLPNSKIQQTHTHLKQILFQLQTIKKQLKHLNTLQIFYNIKETNIPGMESIITEYQNLEQIWKILHEQQCGLDKFRSTNVANVPARKESLTFQNSLRKLEKFIKNIEYFQLCKFIIDKVKVYIAAMQFIAEVQFEDLRQCDIQEMNQQLSLQVQASKQAQTSLPSQPRKQIISKKLSSSSIISLSSQKSVSYQPSILISIKSLTLSQILSQNLYSYKYILQQITFKCRKQLEIKQMIQGFQQWWKLLRLNGQTLDQYPLIVVFQHNQHVRKEIDEYTTIMVNILNHKYGAFVRRQATNHLKNIDKLAQLLRIMIEHQQKFLTLFPILTSKYAQKHLSMQYKKFQLILTKTMKNLRLLSKPTQNLTQVPKSLLLNHIKSFDSILKYLSQFLEKKRIKFQRFYFLQDNQMLEVLLGTENQNNCFRMFQGIQDWLTDQNGVKVGVKGIGGDQLLLKGWVYKTHQPEVMFRSLEDAVKNNLNSIVRNILHGYQNQLKCTMDVHLHSRIDPIHQANLTKHPLIPSAVLITKITAQLDIKQPILLSITFILKLHNSVTFPTSLYDITVT